MKELKDIVFGNNDIKWDGYLPERRYAMFTDIIRGNYIIVVKGNDMITAPKWVGFVKWIGGVRPSELRKVNNEKDYN